MLSPPPSINIPLEDTVAGATRELQPAENFANIITAISNHISRTRRKLFLDIRTDGFLLDMQGALAETMSRIKIYESA